jgi:hypothetical protein
MELLSSYTAHDGTGDKHKFPIDRNCSRILVKRVSPASISLGLLSGTPERVEANIRTRGNDVEEVFRLQPLLAHVAAYSALINKEPVFEMSLLDGGSHLAGRGLDLTGVTGFSPYITYFYLNLTAKSDSGQTLGVSVTADDDFGLVISDMYGGATYSLYAVEEPQTGSNMLSYTSINMQAGQKSRLINVDALDALVLPAIAAISKVKIQYRVGKPIEYNIEGLKLLNAQAQIDEVFQYRQDAEGNVLPPVTISPLISELLVLMVHNVVSIEVVTDGTAFEFTQIQNRQRGVSNQFS